MNNARIRRYYFLQGARPMCAQLKSHLNLLFLEGFHGTKMVNWALFLHKLGDVTQYLPSDREKVLHSLFSICFAAMVF